MKRLFLMLLMLLLAGCAAASGLEVAELKNDPPPAEAIPEEAATFSFYMVTWEDVLQAEDGTTLASYSFQVPELTARRGDGTEIREPQTEAEEQAAAVAEGFNRRFAEWAAAGEFQEIFSAAQERWDAQQNSKDLPIWIGEYTLTLTSSIYQTDQMVSTAGNYYSFTGGAHGNITLMAWNYDLTAGSFFGPELLAEDGQAFSRAVQDELIRQCQEMGEGQFWKNYKEVCANWSSYAVSFDQDGMVVGFSPYELASYAAGPQVFHLSYDWLRPYLSRHGLEILGLE